MRTGCRLWPHIPCGGGCYSVVISRFFPNAECIRSGRVLPSPKGSLEESQISRETMYKVKADSLLKIQLGLLHPVY